MQATVQSYTPLHALSCPIKLARFARIPQVPWARARKSRPQEPLPNAALLVNVLLALKPT